MPQRVAKTHRGAWTRERALEAACDQFSTTGKLVMYRICEAAGLSKSWGSVYLQDRNALLDEVLTRETRRFRSSLQAGDSVPGVLARFANTARELARRGQLLGERDLRRALVVRIPHAPELWGALLGLAATLPQDQVRVAAERLIWN